MANDVIIIGAGLSGLMAAHQLKKAGKSYVILDKGRSVGGRLATRRIGDGIADHGAQFFTVRTSEFQTYVDQWLEDDFVAIWGHGWSDGSVKKTRDDGHPRYIAKDGMNAIAKRLAQSLDNIQVSTRAESVTYNNALWQVQTADGKQFDSKALIMTPPVPQSLELIKDIPLLEKELQELQRITYGPCLCGLFIIDGGINLPEPGALQNFSNTVYWIADNTKKGISPNEHIITMHVEADYSREHYDDPEEDNLTFLRNELRHYLSKGTTIKQEQFKKWRYSIPLTTHEDDILKSDAMPIIFAGDAFGGRGRIEGAFISGVTAGKSVISLL